MQTIDALSDHAGMPLRFDADQYELLTDLPYRFNKVVRTRSDISEVLLDGDHVADSTELYWIYQLEDAGPEQAVFDHHNLTYACVLLPSGKVGREFVKTQGHYHPEMRGTGIQYPEVYSHLFGDIYLLLQRRAGERADAIDDLVLIDMREWGAVTIPPGYAHVLINASDAPAAIAGLYATTFKPVYLPFVELGGAAVFLIDDHGERLIPNERYGQAPPVRRPSAQSDPAFAAPAGADRLWTSFLANPVSYEFLSNMDAASKLYVEQKEHR